MLRCRVLLGSFPHACNMISHFLAANSSNLQGHPSSDSLVHKLFGRRYGDAYHARTSVSVGRLSLRANSHSTCLKICREGFSTGNAKFVDFRACPFVYWPNKLSFGCARVCNFQKPSSLLRERQFCNVGAALFINQVSELGSEQPRSSFSMARISRSVQVEAQEALMEYLYNTRSLQYTDAEHISKNSPSFLRNLLAKVENEEEVGWSVSKFLRYNPINEFEPLLESLGLKPSELYPLLPRNLFFINDDEIFLQNFHDLCNYGIPRKKIGKMYKVAPEIFRYDYGELASKLKAYEELELDTSTVIKLVSSCPSLLVGDIDKNFLQVFHKLKGLGFGHYWIRSCLLERSTYHWDRMLQIMSFLKEMGCTEKDLKDLIKQHPWFLFNESGKKVYCVVATLLKLGMKMDKIVPLFKQYPQVVSGNFLKNLYQIIYFLTEIGMEPEGTARIIYTQMQEIGRNVLLKPEHVLLNLNLESERLCEIIMEDTNQLFELASKTTIKPMLAAEDRGHPLEKTTFLLRLGFIENSDEIAAAQKQFRGRGDQLQERFDVLVYSGLDFCEVSEIVKEAPQILNQTADVLKKKIDYLVRDAGYPLTSLKDFPTYLCYNLDKIKLRCNMFKWLNERGLIKTQLALSSVIASSKRRFEKYYVSLHPEGPGVWESLQKSGSS